jgi:hypothetical protein
MPSTKRTIALVYGLIAGLILIGYSLLLYRSGINIYLGKVAYLGYLILFGTAAAAALAEKKAMGGYLEFREALKACFTVFVVALLLQTIATWVLMNYIDIPFRKATEQEILVRQAEWMRKLGYPRDQIDANIARQQGKNQYALPDMLQGLAISYIGSFLVSLLIAVIVKKKKAVIK